MSVLKFRLGSGREPFVAMRKATNLWNGNDLARIGWMNRTRFRAVLLKRHVRSGPMVIIKIRGEYPTQMALVQNDHVIQAFTAD